jgi:hypothetical protein
VWKIYKKISHWVRKLSFNYLMPLKGENLVKITTKYSNGPEINRVTEESDHFLWISLRNWFYIQNKFRAHTGGLDGFFWWKGKGQNSLDGYFQKKRFGWKSVEAFLIMTGEEFLSSLCRPIWCGVGIMQPGIHSNTKIKRKLKGMAPQSEAG